MARKNISKKNTSRKKDPRRTRSANSITSPVGKNIVLCSDGTGNRGGKTIGTNVWRTYNNIDLNCHKNIPKNPKNPKNPRQISYYADGVGTADFKPIKIIGRAFGWGLTHNIKDLYYFLANNYNKDDKIYLFGFSRGAFTVRSLAGLISKCGIPDRKKKHLNTDRKMRAAVNTAFRVYRQTHRKGMRLGLGLLLSQALHWLRYGKGLPAPGEFKDANSVSNVKIKFVGVWDTVSAVGMPLNSLRWLLDFLFNIEFHNYGISDEIENAYHALSIDDERTTFWPQPWDEKKTDERRGALEQVWFAGVHSNVGGGYPKQGMSLVPLYWMMARAERHDLHFIHGKIDEVRQASDATDRMYDSRSGMGSYYRYKPRYIQEIAKQYHLKSINIHKSVFDRIDLRVQDYAPGHLPDKFNIVVTDNTDYAPGQNERTVNQYASKLQAYRKVNQNQLEKACFWINARRGLYVAFFVANAIAVAKLLGIGFDPLVTSGKVSGLDLVAAASDLSPWRLLTHAGILTLDFLKYNPDWAIFYLLTPPLFWVLRTWFKNMISHHLTKYWWQAERLSETK